jgi:hypothetical protein
MLCFLFEKPQLKGQNFFLTTSVQSIDLHECEGHVCEGDRELVWGPTFLAIS